MFIVVCYEDDSVFGVYGPFASEISAIDWAEIQDSDCSWNHAAYEIKKADDFGNHDIYSRG